MSTPVAPARIGRFGPYEVDVRSGEVKKFGTRVRLGEQPVRILLMLMERQGELVTRTELREQLWTDDTFVDFDHSLNSAVQRLRDGLADTAQKAQWIETVPRRGYRFVGAVEWTKTNGSAGMAAKAEDVPGPTDAPPSENAAVAKPPTKVIPLPAASRFWNPQAFVAALAVLLVLAAVVRMIMPSRSSKPSSIRSLAVLPLENLSGDASQEYFADGMTDELITALANIHSLRVISRRSSMQYKGARKPATQIARELGVDGIVEGSLMRTGNRVHMTVQLIDGSSDSHLWADSYDRDLNQSYALPLELSQIVARQLQAAVSAPLSQHYINPEAHDAYLHGRYFWFSEDDGPALAYYQKAIQLQPDYAAAWSGIADFYGGRAVAGMIPPQEAKQYWETDARKAVDLDASLAEGHNAMAAFYFFSSWDLPRAEAESKRAIDLNPNFAEAFHVYAYILMVMNRPDEAIEMQKRGMDADPFSRPWALGYTYYLLRRLDAAVNELQLRERANPTNVVVHEILSDVYHLQGKDQEALEQWEQSHTMRGEVDAAAAVRRASARGGYKSAAEWRLNEMKRDLLKTYISPFWLALETARAQHKEETLQLLESAYREHSPRLIFIAREPAFDFLHSEPRFQSIVRNMKLPMNP